MTAAARRAKREKFTPDSVIVEPMGRGFPLSTMKALKSMFVSPKQYTDDFPKPHPIS
jgi:hypothetical protein